MNTKVINLYGGSGLGKTTTSAGLFYHMKLKGLNVEQVSEYVKTWAWQGKKPGLYDQPYIFGKQTQLESNLYGKVEYIITDSPILLGPIYEEYYSNENLTQEAAMKFIKRAENHGVEYNNFLLERHKPFNNIGRFEKENQAKEVDVLVENKLKQWNIKFKKLTCADDERVFTILKDLCVD